MNLILNQIEKFIKDNKKGPFIAGRIIEFDDNLLTGCMADSSSKINFLLKNNKKNLKIAEFIDKGDIVGLEGKSLKPK